MRSATGPESKPLDREQRAAVEASSRAIAVLAGPGSGKTRVLSYRARRLIHEDHRANALLLTFTNKAAAEMKARALNVTSVAANRILACTFHTLGVRVLRAHGDLIGVGRDFEIMDDAERTELIEEVARDAVVRDRYHRASYLRLRRRLPTEPDVLAFSSAYEQAKRDNNVVDFDDLVVYTADLFDRYPDVATAYGTRYSHLLVDEFQDTNAAQFAIVRSLAASATTVSVFADDDQAIYRFAGAEAENVRRFVAELVTEEFPLTVNYRCREAIVRCANSLIAADTSASGRRMQAFHDGGEVRSLIFDTVEREAAVIALEISQLIRDGSANPSDIAVLTRAGFRVNELLAELADRGVQVTNWLGRSYQREELGALRTCLSVVRGRLEEHQARRLFSFLGVAASDHRDPQAILELHRELPAVQELLDVRRLAWEGGSLREMVEHARLATVTVDPGLGEAMELVAKAVDVYEKSDPDFSLDHLLTELALGGAGGPPAAAGGVKVASLHRTKGLQWPYVYIVGLEEGRLPDYRANTTEQMREERRACFVGVCRAEQRLTLTRTNFYKVAMQRPSRFLAEMGFT